MPCHLCFSAEKSSADDNNLSPSLSLLVLAHEQLGRFVMSLLFCHHVVIKTGITAFKLTSFAYKLTSFTPSCFFVPPFYSGISLRAGSQRDSKTSNTRDAATLQVSGALDRLTLIQLREDELTCLVVKSRLVHDGRRPTTSFHCRRAVC